MLNSLSTKRRDGFTLIELVIVLAIAALIILVVLQAVGAAQRSNRDNARKQEAGRFVSLLEQYASNNGGNYPSATVFSPNVATAFTAALTSYDATLSAKYTVNNSSTAPTFAQYSTVAGTFQGSAVADCGAAVKPTDNIVIYIPAVLAAGGARDYDLAVCLESGGADSVHPSQ